MTRTLLPILLFLASACGPKLPSESALQAVPRLPAPRASAYANVQGSSSDPVVAKMSRNKLWNESLSGAAAGLALNWASGTGELAAWEVREAAWQAGWPWPVLEVRGWMTPPAGEPPQELIDWLEEITEEAFDTVMSINLRGMIMTCKHVLPGMRARRYGNIINISSLAVLDMYPYVAYKASKSGVVAFTEQLAYRYAADNIRANVILPGLMDTPMAVDTRAREWGRPREEVAAERDARVPLGAKMGTAWDVAHASAFLASDDARFITGVTLPVDGGASVFTA